jgi:PAS domain S-box-containing protein
MLMAQEETLNRPLHILIVGDGPQTRLQIARALQIEFPALEVAQAGNESQLELALANGRYDLVFVESWLSWADSLVVIWAFHNALPRRPVIVIADAEREELVLSAIQAGADSYVLRSSQQMMGVLSAVRLELDRQTIKVAEDRERQRVEVALRESEERFRTIVEQSPISIQVMTPDGWTVLVNQAWEKLWGVTAADVRNYNMLHDEQAKSLGMMPYVERGFAGETVEMPPVAYHTPETLKNGRKRWFQARIYPVKDDLGEIRNVIMMYEDITDRQWATEDLQRLSAELMNAYESERKRMSQELHDELGQALTAMRINLTALEKDLFPGFPASRKKLIETSLLVDETLEHVRELSHALRPTMLDELGLVPTLRWYVTRYAERLGIQVELEAVGLEERLPTEIETALYRIAQEALTNIAKHAQARHVQLRLSYQASQVTASIEDDGVGFDVQKKMTVDATGAGAGLFGMRERVTVFGGSLTIQSRPEQGTRLLIELPILPHPTRGKA